MPKFDPVTVERKMIDAGELPERGDPVEGRLGPAEAFFTEFNDRFYALWRISMVRQLTPASLRDLEHDDLVFLAGQNAEGYPMGTALPGINLSTSKVTQNAARARGELELRYAEAARQNATASADAATAAVGASTNISRATWWLVVVTLALVAASLASVVVALRN